MEALLDFLFDNLFFVIIVLGILSSLFGRSGRKGGGGRMPDFGGGPGGWRMPGQDAAGRPDRHAPVRPHRSGEPSVRPEARPADEAGDPETRRRPYPDGSGGTGFPRKPERRLEPPGRNAIPNRGKDAPSLSRAEDARPAVRADAPPSVPPAVPAAASPSAAPDPAAARSAEAARIAPSLQVEQRPVRPIAGRDELRNAILWAEILGPPRAYKPHSRRRFGR